MIGYLHSKINGHLQDNEKGGLFQLGNFAEPSDRVPLTLICESGYVYRLDLAYARRRMGVTVMKTVFISYSSRNREYVRKTLVADLESVGYIVWLDQKDLGSGEWWPQILEEIRSCDLVIFALSLEWFESQACQREFSYATALGKHRLPVHVIDVGDLKTLAASLVELQIVDYRSADKSQFGQLVKAINKLPSTPPLPDPLPTPPPAPILEIANVADMFLRDKLTIEDQRSILKQLEALRAKPEEANAANVLLQQMRQRSDIGDEIAYQIDALLGNRRSSHGSSPRQPTTPYTGTSFSYTTRPRITLQTAQRLREIARVNILGHLPLAAFAFSPDNKLLAFGSPDDGQVTLWDLNKQQEVTKLQYTRQGFFDFNTGAAHCLAFSPDGKWLASGGHGKRVLLWQLSTGRNISRLGNYRNGVTNINFSPDSKLLAATSRDKTMQVLDVATNHSIAVFRHRDNVSMTAFSPNGTIIASITKFEKPIRLWDVTTQREQNPLLHTAGDYDYPNAIAFSPDGRFLVSNAFKGIRLWEMTARREVGQYSVPESSIQTITFSPDGTMLAYLAHSYDEPGFSETTSSVIANRYGLDKKSIVKVKVLDRETGNFVCDISIVDDDKRPLRIPSARGLNASSISFSPDGTLLATSFFSYDTHSSHVRLWGVV